MHPAFSVIIFTTLAGAGYGLFAVSAVALISGTLNVGDPLVQTAVVVAAVLVTTGLVSSLFHLGHPERAWRALSQWRTSWLSREGVSALLTYVPMALLLLAARMEFAHAAAITVICVVGVVCAFATVLATAMIYGSLKAVPAWTEKSVPVIYLLIAAATGTLLMIMLSAMSGIRYPRLETFGAVMLLFGGLAKIRYWALLSARAWPFHAGQATGVSRTNTVRPLENPHTEKNYLQKEMMFQLASEHGQFLRVLVITLGFAVPAAALAFGFTAYAEGGISLPVITSATSVCFVGVFIERWLFFAEARHIVSAYYR